MPSNKTLNEKKKRKKQKRQGKKRPLKGVVFSSTISQVMFSYLEIGRLPTMMTQIPILLTIYVLYRKVKNIVIISLSGIKQEF